MKKEVEEEECVTPRDSGSRIPEPEVCPPAPRKKQRPYLKPKQLPTGYHKHVITDSEVERVFCLSWEQLKHCS